MSSAKSSLLAQIGIIITTIIWGIAFVVVKDALDFIPAVYMVAIRFSLAAVFLMLVFHKKLKLMSWRYLGVGAWIGLWLFVAYVLQTVALHSTTAGVNAFLTTVYVVWAPFLAWLLFRNRPKNQCLLAAGIAVVGIALLSLQGGFRIGIGELLTLLCGVAFALHMVFIDRFTQDYDPILLTILQMIFVAVFGWMTAPVIDGPMPEGMFSGPGFWKAVLYLGILSTAMGFLLQTVGQKYLQVTTAAILLSLESVFGMLFSVLLLGESLGGKKILGCVLLFGAVLISQIDLFGKKKKKNRPASC